MTQVDIVIVNWNSGAHLKSCVDSVLDHAGTTLGQIVIVDNHSTDNSLALLSVSALARVHIIRAASNLGFAKACNLGARQCSAPFLLFLNPDARLHAHSVDETLAFMHSPAAAGIGICGVQLINEHGQTQRHCARFPHVSTYLGHATGLSTLIPSLLPPLQMTDFDHLSSRVVDHVIGAYFFVRTSLFRKLHGFDERFFVYLEDLDFSLRASAIGFKAYYLASTQAFHKGGGSSEQVKPQRLFYSLRSRLIFAFIHFGRPQACAIAALTLLVEPWPRFLRALMRLSVQELRDTIKAYTMLIKALPALTKTKGQQHA